MPAIEVQGHRGARGLRPENTFAAFELALDLGVTSIETDLQVTQDGVPVVFHDECITTRLCSTGTGLAVNRLPLHTLRAYRIDQQPDPQSFGDVKPHAGPLSHLFAQRCQVDAWAIPTLTELFAFTRAYAGDLGEQAGKGLAQRRRAERVILDLELKRLPFEADPIGRAERCVVDAIERADMVDRARLRGFDHRSVRLMKQLEPRLRSVLLIVHTAPVQPADLLTAAAAEFYAPQYQFVDAETVRQIHDAGKTILPWTVNDPAAWERLLEWGVDGITTDYPDRLLDWLDAHGTPIMGCTL